ncbi:MAG: VOC family protein [Pseudomonadota bacterium]
MLTEVDHLVFGAPELEQGIEQVQNLLGLPARYGGSHPGLGTHMALIPFGSQCYLEIIAPDPDQSAFKGERPFGLDKVTAPRLLTWVASRPGLPKYIDQVRASGLHMLDAISLSRRTAEGQVLEWQMSFLDDIEPELMGVLPMFIDWGESPHPGSTSENSARLERLELQHPDTASLKPIIEALKLNVMLLPSSALAIRAVINCPKGTVVLTSEHGYTAGAIPPIDS